eukprot:10103304-Lingulodinium_polyedra.AAC.1
MHSLALHGQLECKARNLQQRVVLQRLPTPQLNDSCAHSACFSHQAAKRQGRWGPHDFNTACCSYDPCPAEPR